MNDKELQLLNTLAEKLGTTSEYIWEFSVKQATLDSYISLGIFGAWALLAMLAATSLVFAIKYDNSKEVVWTAISVIASIIFSLIVLFYGAASIKDIVTGLKNPEAKAFKTIVSELSNGG